MGRLIALILGGAAIAFYGIPFFPPGDAFTDYVNWWQETLGEEWYDKIKNFGPGLIAGVCLVLLAIRGKD